jgi:glyoxylase-like metal-dependent hydrolase (beta-lactamase superfamily II)/rhodanese-related sulfurtransferase
MIFEQIATGGCQSYFLGCPETRQAVVIDPEQKQIDYYLGVAAREGLRIAFLIDTHTHADHFSASREMAERLGVPVAMHRLSPSAHATMRLDDGDMVRVGNLRLQALHTPGHTRDSMSLIMADRVFTGDTLLIGGTGRTDLPTGDADALFDSLFNRLLRLDPALLVYPAHDYKGRSHSTLGEEVASNPRLRKTDRAEFVAMMGELNLAAPTHLTEALRTNMNGGKTIARMLEEAAAKVPFVSLEELKRRVQSNESDLVVLDVREKEAWLAGRVPGARSLARGQLELRVNEELPDPTARIVACCEFGRISTLAAATLKELGYTRVAALDGGMKAWREAGFPLEAG